MTELSAAADRGRIRAAVGTIRKYLEKNGSTTVAKLTRETQLDEKTIQRGIGWLAQEGKVTIEVVNRAGTIALS